MKPHFASFSTPPLGFKHVIDYEKIPQFGSMSVMKVSSARSNQWWFLTCPKVIAHANRLMDAACRPSCPVYQHPCAKIQQDLITTTSRAPNVARVGLTPRRAFNKLKPKNTTAVTAKLNSLFHTGNTKQGK